MISLRWLILFRLICSPPEAVKETMKTRALFLETRIQVRELDGKLGGPSTQKQKDSECCFCAPCIGKKEKTARSCFEWSGYVSCRTKENLEIMLNMPTPTIGFHGSRFNSSLEIHCSTGKTSILPTRCTRDRQQGQRNDFLSSDSS